MAAPITLTCHCAHNTLLYTPPDDTPLPLPSFYSHSPDHTSLIGSPFVLLTPIASVPAPPDPDARLTLKTSHLPTCSVTFCVDCGGTFYLRTEEGNYLLVGGCIRTDDLRSILKPEKHVGLGNALYPAIAEVVDDGLPRFADMEGTVEWTGEVAEEATADGEGDEEALHGICACGKSKFDIRRPPGDYLEKQELKDWVKPGCKFTASLCFCDSCRLTTGAAVWPWMFTPRSLIDLRDEPAAYESSASDSPKGGWVKRRFCKGCGCGLFYENWATDGVMWDVGLGCIGAKNGKGWGKKWLQWKYEGGEEWVDRYIDAWKERKWGFEGDGEGWDGGLVEECRRGKGKLMEA